MIHNFTAVILNEDGTCQLQEIGGAKGILVNDKKRTYSYEEILDVIEKSYSTERLRFGWEVRFNDGQNKKLFIRSTSSKKCNDTTNSGQTILEWIDYLYDREVKQISLF